MEKLYHLIKSLTKAEKKAFKIAAQRTGKAPSDYLQLYEAIEKMKKYDEEKMKQQYQGASFLNHLAVKKTKLFEQLLTTIRYLKREGSVEAKIYNLIADARHLRERNLFHESDQLLRRAHKLAEEQFLFLALLTINQERRTLLKSRQGKLDLLEELIDEDQLLVGNFVQTRELTHAFDFLSYTLVKKKRISNQEQERVRHNYHELLQENRKLTNNPRAEFWLQHARSFYYELLGDLESAYPNYHNGMAWWDKYPKVKKEEFQKYMVSVLNLLNKANRLNKVKAIEKILKKVTPQKPVTEEDFQLTFAINTRFKLYYYMNQGDWKNAKITAKSIEQDITRFTLPPSHAASISYNMASYYFLSEDFLRAGIWYDKFLRLTKSAKIQQTLQQSANLLLLISIYESSQLDEQLNLEVTLRRVGHFFKKQLLKESTFEVRTFQLLSKITKETLSIQRQLLADFYDYISPKMNIDFYQKTYGFEETYLWILSKQTGKPIIDLMHERATG
jgi:transcriptional regulator CtsR